jgi:proline iminopeptidase
MTTARGRVYCEIEGSGSPVVIVPGGPRAGHAHYHPWFSRLADRHTVAYFDQLGTGASERLPDGHGYSVELYADTVRQVIAYAGHGRAHLIGVSFGGVAAAELAAVRPELVASLVLVDAQVDAQGWQASNIDNMNHQIRTQYPELWRELMSLLAAGVSSGDTSYQAIIGSAVDSLERAGLDPVDLHRPEGYEFDAGTYVSFLGPDPEWEVGGALRGHTVLDRLARHDLPTLVVTGRHDRIATALELPADNVLRVERIAH